MMLIEAGLAGAMKQVLDKIERFANDGKLNANESTQLLTVLRLLVNRIVRDLLAARACVSCGLFEPKIFCFYSRVLPLVFSFWPADVCLLASQKRAA